MQRELFLDDDRIPTTTIFIDESGNESLEVEQEGVTPLFVPAAVFVPKDKLQEIEDRVLQIEKRHSNGQPLKSSGIGPNHQRRRRIIEDLADLQFEYIVNIIQKRLLIREAGFEHKKSFRKYLLSLLFEKIHQNYESASIIADQHGRPTFQNEFRTYMDKRFGPTLFHQETPSFTFRSSRLEPGLRLVDWIAGTEAIGYTNQYKDNDLRICRDILRPKRLSCEVWPRRRSSVDEPDTIDQQLDTAIREYMFERAEAFIEQKIKDERELVRAQVTLVRFLLSEQLDEEYNSRPHYCTPMLLKKLHSLGFSSLKENVLRREVLGGIRDAGIALAGSSSGMRIATCLEDIHDYRDHVSRVVLPMLRRLKTCREELKTFQGIHYDPLAGEKQNSLKAVVDAYIDTSIEESYEDD